MKQQLEQQIAFAKEQMRKADDRGAIREMHTWNGYIQGLRFATLLLNDTAIKQCQCDASDLQPFGACVCGAEPPKP